jgi:peptidoglycan-N-acetylglucosamine deacetylase
MGKREVITRFVVLAVVWLALAAAVSKVVGGVIGDTVEGMAVLLLLFVTWSAFTPNGRLFGRVIASGTSPSGKVAITFDDGPTPEYTPAVLDALRAAGARATFFVLGRNVRAHPDLARRIVADGHELASHGDDHSLLMFAGPRTIAYQFRTAEDSFAEAIGTSFARLFRAPHGYRGPFLAPVARRLGYRMVGWTGAIFDTARPGVDAIVDRCSNVLAPGAIVLLHDGDGSGQGGDRSQTVAALPRVLETARERGLEPVTVSELAQDLKPNRRLVPKAAAFGAVVVAIVFALSRKFDLQVVVDVFTRANPLYVLAALLANLASVGAKALTWKAAFDAIPVEEGEDRVDVGMRDVVPAIFIGFLLNTVLFARLGEVARVSVVRRKLAARGVNVPVPTVVGTVVTEQLLSGATLVAVLVAVVIYVPVPRAAVNLLAVLSGVVIFIGLVALSIEIWGRVRRRQRPSDDYVERWWHLLGISFTSTVAALRRGQAIFQRPRLLAFGMITSTGTWIAQMAGIYLTLHAYGIHKGLGATAVVFLASNLVQLFPITPGNLGVFQGATATSLTLLYGVPANLALTFSIGLQLIEALLGVGVGFVFLSMEGLSVAELQTQVEDESEHDAE